MYWVMRWSEHYAMWVRWIMRPCSKSAARRRIADLDQRFPGHDWDVWEGEEYGWAKAGEIALVERRKR